MSIAQNMSVIFTELGLTQAFIIIPCKDMKGAKYFQKLEEKDWLKYRFCNTPDIHWDEANRHHENKDHTFYVVHVASAAILAEFELDNHQAKTAQIHFSFLPDVETQTKVDIAEQVVQYVLNHWETVGGDHYIDSMYGLTPTRNRPACALTLACGFEKLGHIKRGIDFLGRPTDVMVTTISRENV